MERRRLLAIGSLSGIAMAAFFSIMWIAAVAVNGDWTWGEDTLSELGGQVPSRWIFNIAVMASGVLGISFSAGLWAQFPESRVGRAGSIALAVASVGLISVGIFPIDTGYPHGLATVFFFTSAGISSMIVLIALWTRIGIKSLPSASTLLAIAVSIVSLAITPLPFAEAVTVCCLLGWITALSAWMISDNGLLRGSQGK